jgi:hypothetical protein
MDAHERRLLAKAGLVTAPLLLLALVEWFHPHPHDLLDLNVGTWLFVHYAQIPLFPLAALAVASLLHGHRDMTAIVSRVALFVFAISFVSFDTAAGVVTGILVQAAHASGHADAWRGAIDAIWLHPIVGGIRQPHIPSLSSAGSAALGIGTIAAAVSLRRAGRTWPPVLLLALSGLGLEVFNTHAWPGGPLTFGGIAVASAWIQWSAAQAFARHREDRLVLQPRANRDRRSSWRPARAYPATGTRQGRYP